MAFPKWPARLRSAAPDTGSISPADPELSGMELGRRQLIKRECLDGPDADIAENWLRSAGLQCLRIGSPAPDGQMVILAARSADALSEGQALELAARQRDLAAEKGLGALLGYPACCVERFTGLDLRDDRALFSALLPRDPSPAPAETLWLVGPLSLVSHAPCSLYCDATRALAKQLLAALDSKHAGFAEHWRDLASRMHVMTKESALLSLRLSEDRIDLATRWRIPEAGAAPYADAVELVGTRFKASDYAFVANHQLR